MPLNKDEAARPGEPAGKPGRRAPRHAARHAGSRTGSKAQPEDASRKPGPGHAAGSDAEARKPAWRRLAGWAAPLLLGAVLVSFAVPGAHNGARAAACLYRYAASAASQTPASSNWMPIGASVITDTSASSFSVRPDPTMGAEDEWFGASLAVASYCDYRIDFRAMLTGPLYPVPGAGYGYAVGCRGKVINGVPAATTIQYDPPFRGLRTVDIPAGANAPGFNQALTDSVDTGRYHHWVITVRGNQMQAVLDGKPYRPVDLDARSGNQIIIRVWNSEAWIRDMKISSIQPAL